ncbi:MAG: hypothetical protein HY735_17660 [Verrucomicrobia bacterium]|nr:hypothetical protein [Verrucomicrobiota bacterium]
MKTTIDVPNSTFQQAKSLAEAQGIGVEQLLANAIEEKLGERSQRSQGVERPWMKLAGAFGKTPADRAETRRIQNVIDEEFERIERE